MAVSNGITTFSAPDLTALVQDWVDGDHANLGLLFKWSGYVGTDAANGHDGYGDTYLSKEHTGDYIAPQLVVTYVPEPATMALFLTGGLALLRRRRA